MAPKLSTALFVAALCSSALPLAQGRRLSDFQAESLHASDSSKEAPGSPKEWDSDGVPWKDSNVAGLGSDEDKALRKKKAYEEPAWQDKGTTPGIMVWRIENFAVKEWPLEKYGEFHEGDSYIVLFTEETDAEGENPAHFVHDIFFWLGSETSIDERGVAAIKTIELDDYFDGEPTQHREVQGQESEEFKKLFKHEIKILPGGVKSGFRKVLPPTYRTVLYKVSPPKTRKRSHQEAEADVKVAVPLQVDSLTESDFFILDHGLTVYVWGGKKANLKHKYAAHLAAKSLAVDDQKQVIMVEGEHENARFKQLLGSMCPPHDDAGPVLFELSDESGSLVCSRVSLTSESLNSMAVMVADLKQEIIVWVGGGASNGERQGAMRTALDYLAMSGRTGNEPITMIKEGQHAPRAWNEIFADKTTDE